jgi:guanine nucleotide-binding protein subunit alpha
VKGVPVRILDPGGQHSELKKWIHYLEGVNTILFCVAISEYDQSVPEDTTKASDNATSRHLPMLIWPQNRLQETLELFDSIIHSQFFQRLSIAILFTKLDIFQQKIPNVCEST